jgi:hypothetical protein
VEGCSEHELSGSTKDRKGSLLRDDIKMRD